MRPQTDPTESLSTEVTSISYPIAPRKNPDFRASNMLVTLTTNLYKLEISKHEQKLCIYSVSLSPEIAKDNYPLFSKIQRQVEPELSKYFTKKFFSGNNLFASSPEPKNEIICEANIDNSKYQVKFTKVGGLDITEIIDFEGENQKKKSFVEKVIKDIILKNRNTIKFGDDRTIVKIHDKNVINAEQTDGKETIYKGFFTSAQITENGLFLLVSNVNKHVSEVTVWDAIKNLRDENKRDPESRIREKIKKFLEEHRTVLTVYGSLRAYRIKDIDYDASPSKTTFNIKDGDKMETITIQQYYKQQYKIDIKDSDQPILIAERKTKGKNKNKKENNNKEEEKIYLVPELLYITGPTNSMDNNKDKRRGAMQKTKSDPNKKMYETNKFRELIENNSDAKNFKGKDGNSYQGKTPHQVAESWGINLGSNLEIQGRVLPQPKLQYGKKNIVRPNNGLFRSGNAFMGVNLNQNNFIYVYDRRDNSDIRNALRGLLDKGRMKGLNIRFNKELNQNDIHGICIENYNNFQDIERYLSMLEQHKNEIQMAVVFLSPHLE